MIDVLLRRHEAIVAACARHGVARLEAYACVEAYFGLLSELRALLEGGVDLVMVGAVKNPYIARNIERAYLADVIDSCEAIVEKNVPLLRRECTVLLKKAGRQEERE